MISLFRIKETLFHSLNYVVLNQWQVDNLIELWTVGYVIQLDQITKIKCDQPILQKIITLGRQWMNLMQNKFNNLKEDFWRMGYSKQQEVNTLRKSI